MCEAAQRVSVKLADNGEEEQFEGKVATVTGASKVPGALPYASTKGDIEALVEGSALDLASDESVRIAGEVIRGAGGLAVAN